MTGDIIPYLLQKGYATETQIADALANSLPLKQALLAGGVTQAHIDEAWVAETETRAQPAKPVNKPRPRKSMGDYMLEKGYIKPEELEDAKKTLQNVKGGDMARILTDIGIDPVKVYEAKAQELGQPFVDLNKFAPEQSAVSLIPDHVARRHNVIPIKKDANVLYVAMSDTNNLTAYDDLKLMSRSQVKGVIADPEQIRAAIATYYGETA